MVVITDYPDKTIMDNLRQNIERNRQQLNERCEVRCVGYEWGTDLTAIV